MPLFLGSFETSLRGGDSPSMGRKDLLHKGCCGDLHGHGVKKEKNLREVVAASRFCSIGSNGSSEAHLFVPEGQNASSGSNQQSFKQARRTVSPSGSSRLGSVTPDLLLTTSVGRPISVEDQVDQQAVCKTRRSTSCISGKVLKGSTPKSRPERSEPRIKILEASSCASSALRPKKPVTSSTVVNNHLDEDSGNFSSSGNSDGDEKVTTTRGGNLSRTTRSDSNMKDFVQGLIYAGDDEADDDVNIRGDDEEGDHDDNEAEGHRRGRLGRFNGGTNVSIGEPEDDPTSFIGANLRHFQRSLSHEHQPQGSSGRTSASSLKARAKSQGLAATSVKREAAKPQQPATNYAFGSRTSRFKDEGTSSSLGPPSLNNLVFPGEHVHPRVSLTLPARKQKLSKRDSDEDGKVRTSATHLGHRITLERTASDSSTRVRPALLKRAAVDDGSIRRQEVTETWMMFKRDVELTLDKKPGPYKGNYKNLSNMMLNKMGANPSEVRSVAPIPLGSLLTSRLTD